MYICNTVHSRDPASVDVHLFLFQLCKSPNCHQANDNTTPYGLLISANHNVPQELNTKQRVVLKMVDQCTASNTGCGALMMFIYIRQYVPICYILATFCYALFKLLGQVCSKIQSWGCLQRWKLTKNLGGHCGASDFSGESKIDHSTLNHIHL